MSEATSKITVENFTPNEVIDSITDENKSVGIVGFVDEIRSDTNFYRSRYYKFVLNNGQGRRVQVVGWNECISDVNKIIQIYKIVHAENLVASKPINQIYNLGNINYELLLQNGSIVTTYGSINDKKYIVLTSMQDSIDRIGFKIKIEGYLKSLYPKKKRRGIKYYAGAITDGYFKLNIIIQTNIAQVLLRFGQAISLIGVMERDKQNEPRLRVNDLSDISMITDRNDLPLETVNLANVYPQRFA